MLLPLLQQRQLTLEVFTDIVGDGHLPQAIVFDERGHQLVDEDLGVVALRRAVAHTDDA